MHTCRTVSLSLVLLTIPISVLAGQGSADMGAHKEMASEIMPGHSVHGQSFDVGPRQKPWVIPGIGQSHFPITSSNHEVQMWFDQGNSLLHSYWFYEAERAFRWTLKLDPECAMCYWGMARASGGTRRATFVREAVKRKNSVTPRERLYIEAWERRWAQDNGLNEQAKQEIFEHDVEEICQQYPTDLEARLLLASEQLYIKEPYAMDAILQEALSVAPRHPGALHYRIHLWELKEPGYILANASVYRNVSTGASHGQHAVGHIYTEVGMWHEAAISMDIGNRMELRYMREHMVMPFRDWNYVHNRDFLSYIQEQLGMYESAVAGARELINVPLDPKYNNPMNPGNTHALGLQALARALVKFEQWKMVLDSRTLPWGSALWEQMYKNYSETLAWIGLGNLENATASFSLHEQLKSQVETGDHKDVAKTYAIQSAELNARLELAKGDTEKGLALLTEAAKQDFDDRKAGEMLRYGSVLYNVLGEAYLARDNPELAASAFEKTLEVVKNDGFALAGLVTALAATGKSFEAQQALGRLLFVWSDADKGLKWLERSKALQLIAKPIDSSPLRQRRYKSVALEGLGPGRWESFSSPILDALDSAGQKITLERFKGTNILMVFQPSGDCQRCRDQLAELQKRKKDFSALGTEIVAINGNAPQGASVPKIAIDPQIETLFDPRFEDARRFHAYDDFEEIPLNETLLIDKHKRVYWSYEGADPFTDVDFLLNEIHRMNDRLTSAGDNQP